MDPADGVDRSSTSWEPWHGPSGAKVAFIPGERHTAERIARRLFHRPLERWEYAGLVGAPDDAQVDVGTLDRRLYIELSDPTGAVYHGHYYVGCEAERIVMVNEGFHISHHSLQCHGLGTCIFHWQMESAAALSVNRIELTAGRRRDENGYYTWPRFGFQGWLPAQVRRTLPHDLQSAETVLDLMECRRGRAWWREYGVTIGAAFDLTPGSRSREAWGRYLHAKMKFSSGTKTNLENRSWMSYRIAR